MIKEALTLKKMAHVMAVVQLLSFNSPVLAGPKIAVTDTRETGVYIVSVSGSEQSTALLLARWQNKASALCKGGGYRVEPNGQPVVHDKRCSDAVVSGPDGLRCLEVDASVFGKVVCEQAPPSVSR
ncbi:hypothetical protein PRUB_a0212 [Pseudoalteromonas rubra]|uniref:Uncharacterized protein n=1 Tax=Pseudoalteromonas rubra TaxID=43658 RepID=A0A8T0C558_9GAMM|nr:hypothetical protein [Pseudoalteromonas rubra]KAF7785819.1 hypothetical protein PRUB_a0212 [Pseudoalteromonas rubra]